MSDPNETTDQIYAFCEAARGKTLGSLNVQDTVNHVLKTLDEQLTCHRVNSIVDIPQQLNLATDRSLFKAAINCLCAQAIQSMPRGGEVVITAVAQDQAIELEVADSRNEYVQSPRLCGNQEFQDETDALHPVYQFVAIHGGLVRTQNCPEGGVAFTIHLPLVKALRSAA